MVLRVLALFLVILSVNAVHVIAEETRPLQEGKEAQKEQETQKEEPKQEVWNFSLAGHDATGNKKWEINGDTASVFSDEKIGLKEVKATSFGSTGQVDLSSKTGTFDKVENQIFLKQDVVAQSSDGVTLKSDYLNYKASSGEIETDAFVEIEQKQMKAFAYGAEIIPEKKKTGIKEKCDGHSETFYDNHLQGPVGS